MKAKVTYTLNGEEDSISIEGTHKDVERGVSEIENITEDTYVERSGGLL